jgi:Rrf2 family iron-sulfur cluster assembly transcriptional regulator
MQLSTRGRYAVMAMAELAARETPDGHPVTLAELAGCQGLSLCYLEQLFCKLRRAGLVVSARGPGGGYRLARPADQVAIADVLAAVEEELRATRCLPGESGCLANSGGPKLRCRTHALWAALGHHIHLFLAGVTLDDVVTGRLEQEAPAEAA